MPLLPLRVVRLAALALALGGTADAQQARPEVVAVPVPETGVFYYRAGSTGGVVVRGGQRAAAPAAQTARQLALRTAGDGGADRLGLTLLERSILDALDRRLAGLDDRRRRSLGLPPAPPVIVVPGQPGAPATPVDPLGPDPSDPGAPAADPSLIAEVERAILEAGLFRTTRVPFEFGQAGLLPVAETTLAAVADVLRRYPALRVEIGGHTDAISSATFNLGLSQLRADAVRAALVGRGVGAGRLTAVGYGEERPIATNETETGRALNRRVEFTVLNPEAGQREARTVREATPGEAESLRDVIRQELEQLRREEAERDGG